MPLPVTAILCLSSAFVAFIVGVMLGAAGLEWWMGEAHYWHRRADDAESRDKVGGRFGAEVNRG